MSALRTEDLVEFIRDELGVSEPLDPETPLYSSGLLDSYALVDIATFIEGRVGIKIDVRSLSAENFDTIGRTMALVEQQRRRQAGDPS